MSAPRQILDRLAALGITPTGVADDSRQVRPGDLFLAYPGDLADGRRYIADAIARGAVAILWQPGGDFAWNPAWTLGPAGASVVAANLQIDGLRALAGPLAHLVCGEPSASLSLIAVTGTNGKTTVSQFIAGADARRCAVIGTLGAGFPGALVETGFTTPEATTLMRLLAGFRQAGAEACRALSQSGLFPANARLIEREEAMFMGAGDGQHHVLVLGSGSAGLVAALTAAWVNSFWKRSKPPVLNVRMWPGRFRPATGATTLAGSTAR